MIFNKVTLAIIEHSLLHNNSSTSVIHINKHLLSLQLKLIKITIFGHRVLKFTFSPVSTEMKKNIKTVSHVLLRSSYLIDFQQLIKSLINSQLKNNLLRTNFLIESLSLHPSAL